MDQTKPNNEKGNVVAFQADAKCKECFGRGLRHLVTSPGYSTIVPCLCLKYLGNFKANERRAENANEQDINNTTANQVNQPEPNKAG